ncbi:MAG: hypothetical protein ACO3RV_10510, partial [Luteolibacter sp.]
PVSDPNQKSLSELLSGFELGPAWAKANAARTSSYRDSKKQSHEADSPPRNASSRHRERRRADDPKREQSAARGKRGSHAHTRRHDSHAGPSPRESFVAPAEGVRVTLTPDTQAIRLVGKEVHQVARVYPLIDVARILLAERGRCRARFEAAPNRDPMYRGKLDDSLFLSRDEAVRHLWSAELRTRFMEEETIETEPPSGNFLSVARCGISGEWLGPPNFHTYQTTLRRLHQDQFPHLPFAAYQAKVKIERGDEAVQAWLETQKKQTRWRLIGADDESWISDPAIAARTLASSCFDQAFEPCHHAEMLASVPESKLSPSLMTSLRMAGNHARKHPAVLIASICQA